MTTDFRQIAADRNDALFGGVARIGKRFTVAVSKVVI